MKSVSPIGAAEERSIAVDVTLPLLGRDHRSGADRVFILHTTQNLLFVDVSRVIQRHAVLLLRLQALQDIHVVSDSDASRIVGWNMAIPGGPSEPTSGH